MVFWPKLSRRVWMERSWKNFLLGPKVSELGPNLAHLAHQENVLIFILRLLLRRTFSFHAFSYNANFHSPPSPTTLIFIPRLLLQRLFSFPALSLIFISRILIIRLFSLCKYQHRLSQCLDQVEPFPRPYLVGGASTPPGLQKPNTAGQVSCLGDER